MTTETDTQPTHRVSERIGPGSVSAARVGPKTYEGLNERGSTVLIGAAGVEGAFTPSELLKLALVACAAMSADAVVARRLGDDVEVTGWAHGRSDHGENRYPVIHEELLLDTSGLEPAERERLLTTMGHAIARGCTVARTIEGDVDVITEIDGTTV